MDENTENKARPVVKAVEPAQPQSLSAAATPKATKSPRKRTAKPRAAPKSKAPPKPKAAARPKVVKVPGSGQATVEGTLGKHHFDVPRSAQRRVTMDPHSMDAGDKKEGLAKEFHDEQDQVAMKEAEPAVSEREAAMRATKQKGVVVPEEDRRRAVLSKRIGVDLFKRGPGQERPDEPSLKEVNDMFFMQADAERYRQSELQEQIGDTLVAAFGRKGKRLQKSLR